MDTKAISKALNRLAASDTYVKRRNALRAFDKAVADLKRAVQEQYPKLRKDGTAIVRRKPSGAFCPECRVPMKSSRILALHMQKRHRLITGHCWCGFMPPRFSSDTVAIAKLVRHLVSVPDLLTHYGMEKLKESAGVTGVK